MRSYLTQQCFDPFRWSQFIPMESSLSNSNVLFAAALLFGFFAVAEVVGALVSPLYCRYSIIQLAFDLSLGGKLTGIVGRCGGYDGGRGDSKWHDACCFHRCVTVCVTVCSI